MDTLVPNVRTYQKGFHLNIWSKTLLKDVPEPFKPPTTTLVLSMEDMAKFWIQKPLPGPLLPDVLLPTINHPLQPPTFHYGIPLPLKEIMEYLKQAQAHPDDYGGEYYELLRSVPRDQLTPPDYSAGDALLIEDTVPDSDNEPLIAPNRVPEYSDELIANALKLAEQHIYLPIGTVRIVSSVYRNVNYVPVLSFFSNYENECHWMSEEDISVFLNELGMPGDTKRYWWCTDYEWTWEPKDP